jgi:cell division protein FtsB
MARAKRRARPQRKRRAVPGEIRRARLVLLGAVVVAAGVLFAWFPASSLLSQRSDLGGTESQLSTLHSQDAALAQEQKNLSDGGEIGRIAREQYQLVGPGQQPYEVLPPAGSTTGGIPYAGDPGSNGPVTPSAASELPPGDATSTTAAPVGSSAGSSHASSAGGASGHGGSDAGTRGQNSGLVSRMVHALEFWR